MAGERTALRREIVGMLGHARIMEPGANSGSAPDAHGLLDDARERVDDQRVELRRCAETIALNASTTATIRAPIGIESVIRPSG